MLIKRSLLVVLAVIVFAAVYVLGIMLGWYGELEDEGTIVATQPRNAETRQAASDTQHSAAMAAGVPEPSQILFGDLHVHTTFSSDAFRMSLPMVQGDGTHPPADACDFARICSNLDFWALTDHAESLTPELWQRSIDSVQQCNAIAGAGADPDMVTFMGYEWTQSGATPDTHYGHKNVIFRNVGDDQLPSRPISSPVRGGTFASIPVGLRLFPPLRDLPNRQRYYDFGRLITEIARVPNCDAETPSPDLPANCAEIASTPVELFRKLDEWRLPSIVIPHGTSWGVYSPAGTTFDKQLAGNMHDPDRQTLLEVYSGHGSSEVYREWRGVRYDDEGKAYCPEPVEAYLPSCWRAGEIVEERCNAQGIAAEECAQRAVETRQRYVDYGLPGWHSVPGTVLEDWLDSGQCRDCFLPAFNYRPGGSAQYALAIGNFDDAENPARFRFGFIASSDNHTARPGTGYKEFDRNPMVDWWGYRDAGSRSLYSTDRGEPEARPRDVDVSRIDLFNILELERQASFFSTGGLVAVHAQGRDRDAIWNSLERKEVYGTSGERMLLWFDLVNSPDGNRIPMGGDAQMSENPSFAVRALGSFEQRPGCPSSAEEALGSGRLANLCRGECYHPSDTRKSIDRIEVIRIRPQQVQGESVASLIDDPWRTFDCPDSGDACSVEFTDEDFQTSARDAVYYVRAVQEPRMTINAGGLRCETNAAGECIAVNACYQDDRTAADDDCMEMADSLAWSSPIFVDHAAVEAQ